MISLSYTHNNVLETLTLPEDLDWVNEFAWPKIKQSLEYTTTGATIIDVWTKQSGRPITLQGAEDRAWCTRSLLTQLETLAQLPGKLISLNLRGSIKNVIFDHENTPIESEVIMFSNTVDDIDPYRITLRFIQL